MDELCAKIQTFACCLIPTQYDRENTLSIEVVNLGVENILNLINYELAQGKSPLVIQFTINCLNKLLHPNSNQELFLRVLNSFSQIFEQLPRNVSTSVSKTLSICILHLELQNNEVLHQFLSSLQNPQIKLFFFNDFHYILSKITTCQLLTPYYFHYLMHIIPLHFDSILSTFLISPENYARDSITDIVTSYRKDNLNLLSYKSNIEFNDEIYNANIVPFISQSITNICQWICTNYSLTIYQIPIQRNHLIEVFTAFVQFIEFNQEPIVQALEHILNVEAADTTFNCYEQINECLSKIFQFSVVTQPMVQYLTMMIQMTIDMQSLLKMDDTLSLIFKIKNIIGNEQVSNLIAQIFTFLIGSFSNFDECSLTEICNFAETIKCIIADNPEPSVQFMIENLESVDNEIVMAIFVFIINELFYHDDEEEEKQELVSVLLECSFAILQNISQITSDHMLIFTKSLTKLILTLSSRVKDDETLQNYAVEVLSQTFELVSSDFVASLDSQLVYELLEDSYVIMEAFNIPLTSDVPILCLPTDIIQKMANKAQNALELALELLSVGTKQAYKAACYMIVGFIEGKPESLDINYINNFMCFPQYAILVAMSTPQAALNIAMNVFQNSQAVSGSFLKGVCRACLFINKHDDSSISSELIELICSNVDINNTNASPLDVLSQTLAEFLERGGIPGQITISFIINWCQTILVGNVLLPTAKNVICALKSLPSEVILAIDQQIIIGLFEFCLIKAFDDSCFIEYFSSIIVTILDENQQGAVQLLSSVCSRILYGEQLIQMAVNSFNPDATFKANQNRITNALRQIEPVFHYSSVFV